MMRSVKEQKDIPAVAPLEIEIEIMKRLPAKSLMKFMSVSKSWNSVIRSSPFIADYNRTHNIKPPYKFFVGYDSEVYVDNIFTDDGNGFAQGLTVHHVSPEHPDLTFCRLIGYSQGLFGFCCYNSKKVSSAVIWNPSIRKSVPIPLPKRIRQQSLYLGFTVCNATDPTIFNIAYRYKKSSAHWYSEVEIYTLNTGEWTTLSNAPPRKSLDLRMTRVVIDEFIYWIINDKMVLSLDLTTQEFTELCLPPALVAATSKLHLYELRKSLVIVLANDDWDQEIGVWMMEPGVQNSFTKLYNVKVPPDLQPTRSLDVLGFTNDGQPIFQKLVRVFSFLNPSEYWDRYEYKVMYYELDSKCFKDIGISRNKSSYLAGSYMETLLLLDHPDSV